MLRAVRSDKPRAATIRTAYGLIADAMTAHYDGDTAGMNKAIAQVAGDPDQAAGCGLLMTKEGMSAAVRRRHAWDFAGPAEELTLVGGRAGAQERGGIGSGAASVVAGLVGRAAGDRGSSDRVMHRQGRPQMGGRGGLAAAAQWWTSLVAGPGKGGCAASAAAAQRGLAAGERGPNGEGLARVRVSAWPARRGVMVLRTPEVNPLDREQVPAAGTYRAGEPVWVHRHGRWNPGTVREASARAVLVDYHVVGQRGSLTDTVMDLHVMRRDDPDPLLDTGQPRSTRDEPVDRTDSGGEQ